METRHKVAGGAGVVGAAFAILMNFIPTQEGKTNVAVIPVPGDVPTICYGHQQGVHMGDKANDQQCIQFLRPELDKALAGVSRLVKTPISPEELAAYGSLVYNVGIGNFAGSTMLTKINIGDRFGACQQFPRWVYFHGKKLKGLINRRAAEMALCLKGLRHEP